MDEKDLFEKAFSDFLERKEYEEAEEALFYSIRTAFKAGWLAAGGEPLPAQPVFRLYKMPAKLLGSENVNNPDHQMEGSPK